jgi:dihydroneopterin aldolase
MAPALAAALVVGCGYSMMSPRNGAGATPVAVPPFENRTFEPYVDARVTERVRARLLTTGPWALASTPESAGVVIRGIVTNFSVITVSFDDANRPLEQRIAITADITAVPRDGASFHSTITATAEYRESADALQTRTAKNRAIEEVAENVARELTARLSTHLQAQRGSSPVPATP